MRIPKQIKIRGKVWKVELRPDLKKRGVYINNRLEKVLGLCVYRNRTLYIDSSQTLRQQKITLIHEVLHAAWPMGRCSEEYIVEHLDGILYDVLVRYLFRGKSWDVKAKRKKRRSRRK